MPDINMDTDPAALLAEIARLRAKLTECERARALVIHDRDQYETEWRRQIEQIRGLRAQLAIAVRCTP